MCGFNAMGQYIPPMILFPGKRIRDVGFSDFLDAVYYTTEPGWMTADAFFQYLQEVDKFLTTQGITRPVILYVDGHSSHVNLQASHYCKDKQIILYCLLAHATHVLQPCDVSLFGPLKTTWKAEVKNWQMDNLGEPMTKKAFPLVFKRAYMRSASIHSSQVRLMEPNSAHPRLSPPPRHHCSPLR